MSLFVVVLVDKFIKLLRNSLRATRLRNISRIEHRKRVRAGDRGDPAYMEYVDGKNGWLSGMDVDRHGSYLKHMRFV